MHCLLYITHNNPMRIEILSFPFRGQKTEVQRVQVAYHQITGLISDQAGFKPGSLALEAKFFFFPKQLY